MRRLFLTAILFISVIASGSSAVIYSNFANPGGIWNASGQNFFWESADRLQFAGAERTLQSITFWLAAPTFNPNGSQVDVIYRVRAIDGSGLPGAVLAQASQRVSYNTYDFKPTLAMPAITLPNEIMVSVEMLNGTDSHYGLITSNPPTIGSSDPEVWYRNAPPWFFQNGQGQGWGNLGVEVQAVPEPTTLIAIGAGLAMLARKRRR